MLPHIGCYRLHPCWRNASSDLPCDSPVCRGSPAETRVGHRSAERSSARLPLTNAGFAVYVVASCADTVLPHTDRYRPRKCWLNAAADRPCDCPVYGCGSPAETRERQTNANRSSARLPLTNARFAAYVVASDAETMLPDTGCRRLRKCRRRVAYVSVNLGQCPSVQAAGEPCEVVRANTRRCEQSCP